MADVHLGARDWKQLRKLKLFVVPAIAKANYEDHLKKADLGKHALNGKAVSIRISSDLCESVPVTHEKAEAALLAFNAFIKARPNPELKSLNKDDDIVASVFRPAPGIAPDTVDLFSAGTTHALLIEKLSGLHALTLMNIKKKGRLNAHTCICIGRSALAVRAFHGLAKASLESFGKIAALRSLMAWSEPPAAGKAADAPNFLLNVPARHTLLDEFLAFVAGLTVEEEDGHKIVQAAAQPLRAHFTSDYTVFKPQLAQGENQAYLLHEDDQVAAPRDWQDWTRR